MINYTYLLIGLLYACVLPGFVVVEALAPRLAFWKKLPLYMLLSVITSCYVTYFVSLFLGFSRQTISICFIIFAIPFSYLLIRRVKSVFSGLFKNRWMVITGLCVYAIYFIALTPAIFALHDGYFVMGGPNWQDTAMHQSIIESLAQGNFPPQAPYFSGQSLSYYYFSDFHASIVNVMYGQFFPRILVILNPFLAAAFFFSVYALAYHLSKSKVLGTVAGLMAVLYGNLGFINLLKDLISAKGGFISLITQNAYNFDKSYLQMAPLADYFLQNRPMMVGLPAFTLVVLLLLSVKKTKQKKASLVLFAGIIAGSLVKFQLFGLVISWIFFGVYFGLSFLQRRIKFKRLLRYLVLFGLPSVILILLFATAKIQSRSIIDVFSQSFSWGPWQKQPAIWFIGFLFANMNIAFVLYLLGFLEKGWKQREILAIFLVTLILTAIPLSMTFTIYEFDMLKFFYYTVPLVCASLAYFFSKTAKKRLAITAFAFVTLITTLTSIAMLFHSYFNKGEGYSYSDYVAGMWIRNFIPENSVFVTMPTVHSPPSDIAGRLRIISYTNWPYSHGFNTGIDNVFSRVDDVEAVYKTGDTGRVKVKYEAGYVYYGGEERGEFPEAEELFNTNKDLSLVYNQGGIEIYKIK